MGYGEPKICVRAAFNYEAPALCLANIFSSLSFAKQTFLLILSKNEMPSRIVACKMYSQTYSLVICIATQLQSVNHLALSNMVASSVLKNPAT